MIMINSLIHGKYGSNLCIVNTNSNAKYVTYIFYIQINLLDNYSKNYFNENSNGR